MTGEDPQGSCGCKVGVAVETYGLDDLPAALERRHDEGSSLRDLADFVNARIVEAAIAETDADVAGDAESVHAALATDAPAQRRVVVEEQFTGVGIDVDELRSDFVSYQTIRRHFNNCVGRDTAREGVESVEEVRGVVEHARDRCERVVSQSLDRLRRLGVLAAGPLSVRTSVRVTCEDCGRTYSVTELLDRGTCHCRDPDGDGSSGGE